MTDKKAKISASELILSAIFNLQQGNGISHNEISKYIARKYGCCIHKIQTQIQSALKKATGYGILAEDKGMYRIQDSSDDCKSKKVAEKRKVVKKKPTPKRKPLKKKTIRKKKK